MSGLFAILSTALSASPAAVLAASFVWGLLSILLSPCHLSGIPLVMAFVSGDRKTVPASRAFGLSLIFGLAVMLTVMVLGAITTGLGRIAGDIGSAGRLIIKILLALLFVVIGLCFFGLIRLPAISVDQSRFERGRKVTAFLLGALFGIGVGPCTFAFMAPVIGVILETARTRPILAFLIGLAFGAGHAGLIVLAGTFAPAVRNFLRWDESSRFSRIARLLLGGLFLLIAVYFVWKIFRP
jgi:cytochrome c-type biogenesis protein